MAGYHTNTPDGVSFGHRFDESTGRTIETATKNGVTIEIRAHRQSDGKGQSVIISQADADFLGIARTAGGFYEDVG